MTVAVLPTFAQPTLERQLPDGIEPRWFADGDELLVLAPDAEIGWFDGFYAGNHTVMAIERAERLRWLNTVAAGVDPFPLDLLRGRGVVLTNGAGLNAITIAEFAVMGMLTICKGYREVVRAQDRRQWLEDAPGKRELSGTSALVLGAGGIGGRIAALLRPFGVAVTEVRRRSAPGVGPDAWRAHLGEFDWVIVTVPFTRDTGHLIGARELAAMRPDAVILNFARGALIDQDALVVALNEGRIGGAFLDVTDPEPLPPEHPLWAFDSVHITMHLSGRSQDRLIARGAERFLDNLGRWRRGEPLANAVDLERGY